MKTSELKKELQQLKNQSPLHKYVINEIIRGRNTQSKSFSVVRLWRNKQSNILFIRRLAILNTVRACEPSQVL